MPGPDSRPSAGWFQLPSLPACSAPLQGAEVITTQGHKVLPAYPPYCLSSPLLSRTIAIAVLTDFLFPMDKQNPLSWHVNPCPTAHSQHCPVGLLAVLHTVYFLKHPALAHWVSSAPSPLSLPGELPFSPHGTTQVLLWEALSFPPTSLTWFGVPPTCPCPPVLH